MTDKPKRRRRKKKAEPAPEPVQQLSPEELAAEQSLKAAGIPLWMGEGYEEGRKFLASIGLLEDTEAKNIVKSVGKTRTESA